MDKISFTLTRTMTHGDYRQYDKFILNCAWYYSLNVQFMRYRPRKKVLEMRVSGTNKDIEKFMEWLNDYKYLQKL